MIVNRWKAFLLSCVLVMGLTTGCASKDNIDISELDILEYEHDPDQYQSLPIEENGDFEQALMNYALANGFADRSFILSPLSYRTALCLAAEGANGDTQAELLKAMGFNSVDEMYIWYNRVLDTVEEFKENLLDGEDSENIYNIANSIWNNSDNEGTFIDLYKKEVLEKFGAGAFESGRNSITNDVNSWVRKETNEMIQSISNDLSNVNSILVNTLYLKTSWLVTFNKSNTAVDIFVGKDGEQVPLEFMEDWDKYGWYESDDKETIAVSLPMVGQMSFVLVKGDSFEVFDNLNKMENVNVHVKMPKIDLQSSFDSSILVEFLRANGVNSALDADAADFSKMCENSRWHIDNILQVDKLQTDENGLEAAAATAIMMTTDAIVLEEEPEYKEFIADEPFSFFITYRDYVEGNNILLFCGQIMNGGDIVA